MINTWFDSEVYGGAKKSNFAKQDLFYGPESKMEIPCDTCKFVTQCEVNGTECSAFKVWANTGSYKIDKVGKNLKKLA